MPRVGFEPAIPATNRPQTYVIDRAAARIGNWLTHLLHIMEVPGSNLGPETG
jgi:hypothetical protein